MLRASLLFFVIALLAGALGLFPTAVLASEIAWILFVAFLALAIVSLIMGRSYGPMD